MVKETLKFGMRPIKFIRRLIFLFHMLKSNKSFSIDATISSLNVDMVMNIVKYDTNKSG